VGLYRAWPIVVAAVMAGSASPRGQTAAPQGADYAAAVHAYVVGHKAAEAAGPLLRWTGGQYEAAIESYLAQPAPRLAAAAAFHLEIAIGVVTLSSELAATHMEFSARLIRSLRPPSRNVPPLSPADAAAFSERWHVAAASTFLMVNDSTRAQPFINRGLEVAPRSPELRLMAGIVDEMAALSTNPDYATTTGYRGRLATARMQAFMRARSKFEKLVADEPRFTRARIRLGRVMWMLDDRDAALVELLRAQSEAREPEERYLAAMFLGAVYEQQKNIAGARVAYEAALAAAPRSQAASVALGYLDVMAGRPDRANALARKLLSAPPVEDQWWSYKNGGFETAALAWLRYRVWQ
jgi:tetratricopeptide (TPR) repeat protein